MITTRRLEGPFADLARHSTKDERCCHKGSVGWSDKMPKMHAVCFLITSRKIQTVGKKAFELENVSYK